MKFILCIMRVLIIIAVIIAIGFFFRVHVSAFLNNKALQLFEAGEKQTAFSLLEKSLLINPAAQGYFNLAVFYEKEENVEQAIEKYKRAIKCDFKYTAAYDALIDIYMIKGKDKLALDVINQLRSQVGDFAVEESLRDWFAQKIAKTFNEGVNYFNNCEYSLAKQKFAEVVAANPRSAEGYYGLGMIAVSRKQWQKAIDNFVCAVKCGKKNAAVFNDIGISYMNMEKCDEAVKYLRQAFVLSPEDIDIAYNLASTLRDSGNFKEAMFMYQQIVEKQQDYPNIHNDIGGIYEEIGKKEKALSEYTKEISLVEAEINKGNNTKELLQRKAMAYHGLGKPNKAKEILDQLILRNPDARNSYYYRSQVHSKLGMKKQAEADLKQARKLKDDRTIARTMAMSGSREVLARPIGSKTGLLKESSIKEDTIVYLKNGRIMRGVLEKQTDTQIILKVKMGHTEGVITFARSRIDWIEKID